jgi:hypothetical protein
MVKPDLSDTFTKGGFMKSWGARGYHYTIQLVLIYMPFDFCLARVSTGIPISHRNHYTGKLFCRPPYLFGIYRAGDVEPTITNKYAYSKFLFSQLAYLLD